LEDVAELGLGGVLPVFPDEVFPGDELAEEQVHLRNVHGTEPAQ
jgi:hypothetical protein